MRYQALAVAYKMGICCAMHVCPSNLHVRMGLSREQVGSQMTIPKKVELTAPVVDAGVGRTCWLFDMAQYDRKNSPPLKVIRESISLLQNHYPERLGMPLFSSLIMWNGR